MMTEEAIRARIEELKAQRDKLLNEANQHLAVFDGAIAELERLIAPAPTPTPYSDPENVNLDFTRTGHGANSW